MTALSEETSETTRQHFVDIALACIAEVQDGRVKVNDPAGYIAVCELRAAEHKAGKWDHTLTFRQYATWVQTGKMHSILP